MADPVSSICHGRNFMPLRIIQDKLQPFLTQTFDLIRSICVMVPLTGLSSSFAMHGQLSVC